MLSFEKSFFTRWWFLLYWMYVFELEIYYLFLIHICMYCSLKSNQHPSDLKWRKNVKFWEDLNLHPFNLHFMLLPLSFKCLRCLRWFQLITEPRNYTHKICGLILLLFFCKLFQLEIWRLQVQISAEFFMWLLDVCLYNT